MQAAVIVGRNRPVPGVTAPPGAVRTNTQLALALHRFADRLTDPGHVEQAVAAAREPSPSGALSHESPAYDHRGRYVADDLYLVARKLCRLRPAEALTVAEESATLLTRVPAGDPTEHRPDLASVNRPVVKIGQELHE